jgi:protocatechuate 3,4-dioxygenase, beta subunit
VITTIAEIADRQLDAFPPYLYEAYQSSRRRAPREAMIDVPLTLTELTGPGPAISRVIPEDADMTINSGTDGVAYGQRILVTGRVLDELGEPVPNTLLELWQANAAGRYAHKSDDSLAPLDPNFIGMGRTLTDGDGVYRFITIRPGIYPWANHENAWRPAHIHFSVFGPNSMSRVVTQMYFEDDPLLEYDPIFQALPNDDARERLVASYDHDVTEHPHALGWTWDIVLRGPRATPFENGDGSFGNGSHA